MTITTALVFFQMIQIGFLLGMLFTMVLDARRDSKKRKYDKLVADVAHKVKHG
jgi:hypothetical protein